MSRLCAMLCDVARSGLASPPCCFASTPIASEPTSTRSPRSARRPTAAWSERPSPRRISPPGRGSSSGRMPRGSRRGSTAPPTIPPSCRPATRGAHAPARLAPRFRQPRRPVRRCSRCRLRARGASCRAGLRARAAGGARGCRLHRRGGDADRHVRQPCARRSLTREGLVAPRCGRDLLVAELARMGLSEEGILAARRDPASLAGYLELHIEQGPRARAGRHRDRDRHRASSAPRRSRSCSRVRRATRERLRWVPGEMRPSRGGLRARRQGARRPRLPRGRRHGR